MDSEFGKQGSMSVTDPRTVFVVHGRNENLRKSMFEFLRSINLKPIEWDEAIQLTGQGSPYIGAILDVAFDHASAIVVLMTPDEVAYLQPRYGHGPHDPETEPAAQARPNVLFEAGMALGRDERRTVLVEVGQVREFSDVAGRHAVRLRNDVASRQSLANRLLTAGCDVQLSGTDWHTTGDFTPPSPPGDGLALGRRVPSATANRPVVDFDLQFISKGGNRIDKLRVVNRGTEPAFDVSLAAPDDAGISRYENEVIPKIPGGGKSVTIDVLNEARMMGGPARRSAFDITISARTQAGEAITQDVFLDMNG